MDESLKKPKPDKQPREDKRRKTLDTEADGKNTRDVEEHRDLEHVVETTSCYRDSLWDVLSFHELEVAHSDLAASQAYESRYHGDDADNKCE